MTPPRALRLTQKEIIAALRRAELFSALGEEELDAVASASRAYRYGPGQRVYLTGETGSALYVVDGGTVSVVGGDSPDAQVLASYAAGDTFGEMELFNASGRNNSAFAEEGASLVRFPRRGLGFASFLRKSPEASAMVLREFLRVVSRRIRKANALIVENSPWVQELRRQAYADKLTGLFNKAFLEERMGELCVEGASTGLLMFKPDNFKEINDSFGHEAGDEVLRIAAEALRKAFGEECPTARYLGNEMAVILPGAGRREAEGAAGRVRELMRALDLSSVTGGRAFTLSVSVGAALYPNHGGNGAEVIAAAHELPLLGRARGGDQILFPEDR